MEEVIRPGSADQDWFDRSRRIPWLDVDGIFRSRVLMVGASVLVIVPVNEEFKAFKLSGGGYSEVPFAIADSHLPKLRRLRRRSPDLSDR